MCPSLLLLWAGCFGPAAVEPIFQVRKLRQSQPPVFQHPLNLWLNKSHPTGCFFQPLPHGHSQGNIK